MHSFKDRAGPEAINVDLRRPHFSDLPFRRTMRGIACSGRQIQFFGLYRIGASATLAADMRNSHVALEVLHVGEAIRIAHQNLEDRHLEVHTPSRRLSATGLQEETKPLKLRRRKTGQQAISNRTVRSRLARLSALSSAIPWSCSSRRVPTDPCSAGIRACSRPLHSLFDRESAAPGNRAKTGEGVS